MPSAFVPCGRHGRKRVLVAKCGKGFLLRGVEPFEQAIGRVHGRRLLLHWLAKQASKQQKYKPPKAICQHAHARSAVTAPPATPPVTGPNRGRGMTCPHRSVRGRRIAVRRLSHGTRVKAKPPHPYLWWLLSKSLSNRLRFCNFFDGEVRPSLAIALRFLSQPLAWLTAHRL